MSSAWNHGTLFVLALVIELGFGRPATAQTTDELATEAEAAYDDVRFLEAYELYERVEQRGNSDVETTRKVSQRLAEIAVSIGQHELAVERFRRLLAIWPEYSPGTVVPPPFQKALDEARARNGHLRALTGRAVIDATSHQVTVVIARDTLKLVAFVSIVAPGSDPQRIPRVGPNYRVPLPAGVNHPRIFVHDSFGNRLVELEPVEIGASKPRVDETATRAAPRRWYQRPSLWVGAGAIATASVGAVFGIRVISKQDDLDVMLAMPENHTIEEVRTAQDDLKRNALVANINFGVAGALALGAGLSWWLESRSESESPLAAVTPSRGGLVVSITGPLSW